MMVRASFVFAATLLVYLIYLPGIGGALYYDDYGNLAGLSEIARGGSVAEFVFGGNAGPLGRTIALLTFVPHAAGWPDNVAAILHVNVLIHVANMLLLFVLALMTLALFDSADRVRNFRIALSAALLWAVLPLLVSASLIAIQRMTGLAALFGLLGLIGFVAGYRYAGTAPVKALIVQFGLLGGGTLLAVFSKENGVLIPTLALVIDLVLARNVACDPRYRWALRGGLLICLAVPLYYISPFNYNWFAFNEYRGYTAWERLQTQAVYLWEYIYRAFLPQRPTSFGPFQDHYGIVADGRLVVAATLGWFASLIAAIMLRRRYPLLLFALLWYLGGHLLESTTVMLELVFEHRNYLPIFGFCLLLSWAAWNAVGDLKRIAPILLHAYIALLCVITFSMTLLWGQPTKAAEYWAEGNPRSARAALHSALVEVGPAQRVGSGPAGMEGMLRALDVLDRTARVCPECIDVQMQSLVYSCQLTDEADTLRRFEALEGLAQTGEVTLPVVDAFFPLHELVNRGNCPPIGYDHLLRLAEGLIGNPRSRSEAMRTRLHFVAAMNAQSLGDDVKVIDQLRIAERRSPMALPILQFQVHHFVDSGRLVEARAAIDRRRDLFMGSGSSAHRQAIAELTEVVELAAKGDQVRNE